MNRELNPFPYRLALIDLDDTLLGPEKNVSPANLAAVERLRHAGVEVVIASGRHYLNIIRIRDLAPLAWVLSSHGAAVRHAVTGEQLREKTMDGATVELLCRHGRENGFTLIAYHRDGAFIESESPWTELYSTLAGWTPSRTDFSALDPDGFLKVIWSEDPERIQQWAPKLQSDYSDRVNVLVTNPELIEFFPRRANKALGAEALASRLQISADEMLAFGDGSNDVEMLQWAGLSFAMDHGKEVARRAARLISPSGPKESAFARAVDLAFALEQTAERSAAPPTARRAMTR